MPTDPTTRPAEPGERCECGRQATVVYVTNDFGDVASCGSDLGGDRSAEATPSTTELPELPIEVDKLKTLGSEVLDCTAADIFRMAQAAVETGAFDHALVRLWGTLSKCPIGTTVNDLMAERTTTETQPTAATMADLFPMVPAELREEAVSTAAEITAVTANMRAVLERAQVIYLETDALGSQLYEVFAASGLRSSVTTADAAQLFIDTATGNAVLARALIDLSELASID